MRKPKELENMRKPNELENMCKNVGLRTTT